MIFRQSVLAAISITLLAVNPVAAGNDIEVVELDPVDNAVIDRPSVGRVRPVSELPRAADIDVAMDSGTLSVSGERQAIATNEDEGVQRIERATGRFLRRLV